ncbi:MAG: hypothetical protein HYR85_01440 [Planctomycetes bacterium]|nr:hypothetical protein [Planctomycetota bacterium]
MKLRVLASLTVVALAAGCQKGGGGSRSLLLTMNSTNGRFFVVIMHQPAAPGTVASLSLGVNVDSIEVAKRRTHAIASDTETSSLTFVDLQELRQPTAVAILPAVFSNPLGPVVLSPAAPEAVVFDSARNRMRTVQFERLSAPTLSPEVALAGPVSGFFPEPAGSAVVLSLAGRSGEVSFVDAADPNADVVAFPWPTLASPTAVAFSPLPGDLALATDSSDHFVVVMGLSDLATRATIDEGIVDLGPSRVLAVATAHASSRGLAATEAGDVSTIDFTMPALPVVTSSLSLGRSLASPLIVISPDDAFAIVADGPSGRFGVFRMAEDGALTNVGSFALSATITRVGFTTDDDVRNFERTPFAFALAGTNLFLADLSLAVPVLAPPLNFSAIQDFFVMPPTKGNLIAGVDSSGHVLLFGVSHPQNPTLVSNTDVGIGAGARRVFFASDPAH